MPHAARQNIIMSHGGTHGPAGRTYRQGQPINQADVARIPNDLMGSDSSSTPEVTKEAAKQARAAKIVAAQKAKSEAKAKATKATKGKTKAKIEEAPPPPPPEADKAEDAGATASE